jgi:2-polyprenyl-3-methyl-5-hydroxy-6-metoxy-1,4-benzoquinol methylase
MQPKIDIYDQYALEYERLVLAREQAGIERDPIMPRFLELIGDPSGLTILDACCGEGYLARILTRSNNQVVGMDISPRLIALACKKNPEERIIYHIADLSQFQPSYQEHFDLIVSHLALNDVYDYRGLLITLAASINAPFRNI